MDFSVIEAAKILKIPRKRVIELAITHGVELRSGSVRITRRRRTRKDPSNYFDALPSLLFTDDQAARLQEGQEGSADLVLKRDRRPGRILFGSGTGRVMSADGLMQLAVVLGVEAIVKQVIEDRRAFGDK